MDDAVRAREVEPDVSEVAVTGGVEEEGSHPVAVCGPSYLQQSSGQKATDDVGEDGRMSQ